MHIQLLFIFYVFDYTNVHLFSLRCIFMISRIFCIFLLMLCLKVFPTFGMNADDFQEHKDLMRFKLGLEFQENSALYPWDLDNSIQKKPLFFFKRGTEYLWHVVIDTNDIEFVTRSFFPHEKESLKLCIASILTAVESLRDIFLECSSTTFEKWKDKIYFGYQGVFLLENNITIDLGSLHEIKRPCEKWEPQFSPQVTIQHSLSITIPLYFSLFGFDSSDMLRFSASFPNREIFLAIYKKFELCQTAYSACKECYDVFQTPEAKAAYKASKENCEKVAPGLHKQLMTMYQQLCSPLDGFVFLHALTLVNMTPIEDGGDKQFLVEMLRNQQKYKQIDPKMRLNLMSRRPFSSMLKEFQKPGLVYHEYFKKVVQDNNFKFSKVFDVPGLFNKTNYGEQFFDQHGQLINLYQFSNFFQEDFFFNNKGIISILLNQGIIGTAMLRNFKKDLMTSNGFPIFTLFDDYYTLSIQTVENPSERYIVDPINFAIMQEEEDKCDTLSPPWILDPSNSMGKFKEAEMVEQDLTYGEAIIEVRSIRNVQSWFLRKVGLKSESVGDFLVKPDNYLVDQVLGLFDFLGSFEQSFLYGKNFANEIILSTVNAIKRY